MNMNSIYELRSFTISLCGDEAKADELLKSVGIGASYDYTIDQVTTKYRNMVVKALNDDDMVAKQIAPGIYYVRDAQNENDVAICIIDNDGKITFFNKSIEYANLHEYETYGE